MSDLDSDLPFRGEIHLHRHRRVNHGLGVTRRPGLSRRQEHMRDLRAYLLVVPPSARFTHLTGAALLGWQLPKLPEQIPVFVAVDRNDRRPRRPGLLCSRINPSAERHRRRRHGLPIDDPLEILLRAARDLSLLDMVVLVDSARRKGDVDPARMEALLDSRRPGVVMLREAWRRSSGQSESAGESLLQQFHHVLEIPFEPQSEICDREGRVVARADLLITGTRFLHEYDGAYHRSGPQHRNDLRRERDLASTSYVRKGYVLDDLLNHPAAVMQEMDQALGRVPDLRRLRRWKRLVDNSLYSEAGRERVLNRWRRSGAIVDWSGSA
ncbi:hypothetical protein [Nocardioides mangrovi]|uniref:DUF559 domain-containing protein n=1 Tax=Nocardioides mangrovi TaxID=2874580 RepID=A0ABS7UH02_9ACTN|nr:hypothetical protein [Nocardioides mangrovi]MBZ5739872.1 hypothetical protein [Nocardioides mangrovi]